MSAEPDQVFEAFEVVHDVARAPLFLSCEHASERLPAPYVWPVADARLMGTHWAFDLGARDITLELSRAMGAGAVLSRFTRLLADPNRSEDNADLFRATAEGIQVELNRDISEADRALRLERYHRPYHAALDAELGRTPDARVLLSIHSFTPLYEGQVRSVELGVLFNHEEAAAMALGRALEAEFAGVAYNEPWSGKAGLMHSCEGHAERHGRVALELEVRQDLACDAAYRAKLVAFLARYFRAA